MTNQLEEVCQFANVCVESNYGNDELCKGDYVECPKYKILLERLKELQERRLWNWW